MGMATSGGVLHERLISRVLQPRRPGQATLDGLSIGTAFCTLRSTATISVLQGLAARVIADFAANYDSARERCWVAELDGQIVGSVFVVRNAESVATLRLLYVEPEA